MNWVLGRRNARYHASIRPVVEVEWLPQEAAPVEPFCEVRGVIVSHANASGLSPGGLLNDNVVDAYAELF